MPGRSPLNPRAAQWLRLAGIALPTAIGLATLTVIQAYSFLLPYWLLHLIKRILITLPPLGLLLLLHRRPTQFLDAKISSQFWERLDRASSWILDHLPSVLVVAAVVLLAGWLPHYLQWPWWTDTDHFAVTAQSWDSGILPYRDLLDFNFPGPAYVLWVSGKLFGWGHTAPFYAFDALLLLALGVAMSAWSRRRTGKVTSGLLGYLLFFIYYISLDFSLAAQRDWQAPCFAVLGLLALDLRPGRASRLGSALLFVAAITFRPHTILFLPAYAWAIRENAREEADSWSSVTRAMAEWVLAAALGSLIAFAPLLVSGIGDDLVRSLLASAWYGKSYQRAGNAYGLNELLRELNQWATSGVLVLLVVLAMRGNPSQKRTATTWALALAGMLLYKPLSPVVFAYHHHALMVTSMVGVAVLAASVEQLPRFSTTFRLATLVLIALLSTAWHPLYWSLPRSLQAIASMARNEPPTRAPLGCARMLPDAGVPGVRIHWDDYQSVLDYLRRHTTRTTRVAHMIRHFPCPPVNGPTGRLTPYPCAEGTQWLRWVAPEREGQFAQTLLDHEDSVVVWDPTAPGFGLIVETIEREYTHEITFGFLEIWRRRSSQFPASVAARTLAHEVPRPSPSRSSE